MFTSPMLASLLPGLRDLRAPLAAGYLWLAAGWLFFAPRLPASVNDAHGVLKDIYRVVDASSPVAVAAGVSFIAYMLGILSTGLLKRERVRGVVVWPIQLPLMVLHSFVESRWGKRIRDRWPSLQDKLQEVVWRYDDLFVLPTIRRAELLVLRKLADRAMTDSQYLRSLIQELGEEDEEYIKGVREVISIYTGGTPEEAISGGIYEENLRREIKQTGLDTFLTSSAQYRNRKAIEALVWVAEDVRQYVSEVRDELKVMPARIVIDNPATFEQWDRLNGEAEFRDAVVPPLVAIIVALGIRDAFDSSLAIVLGLVPIAVFLQGVAKENEAQIQLIEAIEADAIKTTALESRLMTSGWNQRRTFTQRIVDRFRTAYKFWS
jgi:hypothetical protein